MKQDDRKNVGGITVMVNKMVVQTKSKTQPLVMLSIMEVELVAAVETVQCMM